MPEDVEVDVEFQGNPVVKFFFEDGKPKIRVYVMGVVALSIWAFITYILPLF